MFDKAGGKQHITEAAPNELKLAREAKVMRDGHPQGGGIGGVRQAPFEKTKS